MTREAWLAATLADAPPLSDAQITAIRHVFAPVIAHMQPAAPALQSEGRIRNNHTDNERTNLSATA